MHIKFWSENLKGRDHLRHRCRWDGNIKMDFKEKETVRMYTGFIWLWTDQVVVSCEHSNEPTHSMKGLEFLDQLIYYQLLKKSAPLK
jgi:hypothetical protein